MNVNVFAIQPHFGGNFVHFKTFVSKYLSQYWEDFWAQPESIKI